MKSPSSTLRALYVLIFHSRIWSAASERAYNGVAEMKCLRGDVKSGSDIRYQMNFRVRRKEHLLDMIVSDSELQQAKQIWVLFASKRSVTKEKIAHTGSEKAFFSHL